MSGETQDPPRVEELDALSRDVLPVASIKAALPHFRRPFAPEAIRWKVQAVLGSRVLIVAHIDARLVIERLNAVVGGAWSEKYVTHGRMLGCHLEVLGQSHYDVGEGRDEKAMLSDALKRVAVRFGIGVSVYALPQVRWELHNNAGLRAFEKNTKDGKKWAAELLPAGVRALSGDPDAIEEGTYAWWVENVGRRRFGPVLDHGDVWDAGGLETTSAVIVGADEQGDLPAAEVEQDVSEEAEAVRAQARVAFDALKAADPRAMLPAQFAKELRAAGGSVADLEAFRERVGAMVRERQEATS